MLHPLGSPNQNSRKGLNYLHKFYTIKSVSDASLEYGKSGVTSAMFAPLPAESLLPGFLQVRKRLVDDYFLAGVAHHQAGLVGYAAHLAHVTGQNGREELAVILRFDFDEIARLRFTE